MSRQVIITDIIPLVVWHLNRMGINLSSETHIRDETLIAFFDEELEKNFSICGSADHCEELKVAIKEARERDEEGFQEYIKLLLDRYIKLQTKLRGAKKLSKNKPLIKQLVKATTDGKGEGSQPPDRLTDFRKKNPYGPDRWIRKKEDN